MRGVVLHVHAGRALPLLHCAPRRATQRRVRVRAEGGPQANAQASRAMQLEESRYLADLLNAPDPSKKAEELAESLTENFFVVASTYLEMAQKEANTEVAEKLEEVLRIAMKAKNKTLRPEIQLLNSLLDESSSKKRSQLLSGKATLETLKMNDQYFFKLVDRMTQDVQSQPDNNKKKELLKRLSSIRKAASKLVFV